MGKLIKYLVITILALGLVTPALAAPKSTCAPKSHVTAKKVVKSSHKSIKKMKGTASKCPVAHSKKPATGGSCTR